MATWRNGSTAGRSGSTLEESIIEYKEQVPTAFTSAAVSDAATSLGATGGVVRLLPGAYTFTAGVAVPRNVHIIGCGPATVINHTGNDVAFSQRDSSSFSTTPRSSVGGFVLNGNSGGSAMGVDMGNCWGAVVHDAYITGYTAGRALREYNATNWCEGTVLENLMLRNNAVGIEMLRGSGTDSFGYQRWRNVAISVPANGIGIDFGGASASTCYVYNGDFDASIWLEGDNAIGVKVRAQANVQDSRFNITGELLGSFTGRLGIDNDGGNLVGYGRVSINAATDDLSSGSTLIRPYPEVIDSGVAAGGVTYRQIATSNPDNRHSGQFGVGIGSNIDMAYVAGYDGGADDTFQVLTVPFGGTPATATKLLGVGHASGFGSWLELESGVLILSGAGTPEGAKAAPVGSLYLRTDGGATTTLYVKTSGAGNTGWTAK